MQSTQECSCECAVCETFARCDGCGALATWHWPGLSYACDACLAEEGTLGNGRYYKPGLTLAPAHCGANEAASSSRCALSLLTPEQETNLRAAIAAQPPEPEGGWWWAATSLLSLLDAARRKTVAAERERDEALAEIAWMEEMAYRDGEP